MDVTFEGDREMLSIVLNLGTSARDLWSMNVTLTDSSGTERLDIDWHFNDESQGYENRLTIITDDDTFTLSSNWFPDSGDFTLRFRDRWIDERLSGTFIVENDGFSLRQDNIEIGFDQSLSLGISATPGVNIEPIEFINLDRWGQDLLDLIDALANFGF